MIVNTDTGKIVVRNLKRADTFWKRFWGLLLHREPIEDEGLLLNPCSSVHTCFMAFAIDIVYLDTAMRVVAVFPKVSSWHFLKSIKGVRQVLEIPVGTIEAAGIKVGHKLETLSDYLTNVTL